jgi:hypothetical protein
VWKVAPESGEKDVRLAFLVEVVETKTTFKSLTCGRFPRAASIAENTPACAASDDEQRFARLRSMFGSCVADA